MFSFSVRTLRGAIVVMGLALFFVEEAHAQWNPSAGISGWATSHTTEWVSSGQQPSIGAASAVAVGICTGANINNCAVGGGGCGSSTITVDPSSSPNEWRLHICVGGVHATAGTTQTGVFRSFWPETTNCPGGGVEEVDGDGHPQCVVPSECDGSVTGKDFWRPVFSADPQGNICNEASGCRLEPANRTELSDTSALIRFVGTAGGCTVEPTPPVSTATQCISQGGNQWCTEPNLADENCGYFNEQFVCLDAIPPGNCTFMGDGGMACASNATAPPAPDNGTTAGVKASPDAGIASSDGTTTNDIDIFNNSTVINSLGGVSGGHPGSGSGPGQGGDGPGDINVEIDFDPIIEEGTDPTGPDDIDQNVADLDALFDEIELEMGEGDSFAQPTVGFDDSIANVLTGSTCADIVLPSSQYMPAVTFPCSELSDLRAVLGWVLRIVLAMQFFNMITTRPGS